MMNNEKYNIYKIEVPIINKKGLDDINNLMQYDYDNFINKIAENVSKDKDIIILQQIIKNQDEKIKKAEKHIIEYKQKNEELLNTIETMKRNVKHLYKSIDKIKDLNCELKNEIDTDGILIKLNNYCVLRVVINKLDEIIEEG